MTAGEITGRVRGAIARLTEVDGPAVTASVGVALAPHDGTAKTRLIDVADRALYAAKPGARRRRIGARTAGRGRSIRLDSRRGQPGSAAAA